MAIYNHRVWKTGLPVHPAILKPHVKLEHSIGCRKDNSRNHGSSLGLLLGLIRRKQSDDEGHHWSLSVAEGKQGTAHQLNADHACNGAGNLLYK